MRRRAPRDQVPEGHLPSHVSPLRRRNYRQHSLIHSPSATNGWPRSRRAMAIASAEGPASSRRDRLRTPGDAGITSGNPMAPGACVPAPHRPIHIDHGMRRTVGVPSWADGLLRGISCPARPAIQPGYLTIKPGPLDALSRHLVHRSIPHAHIPIRNPTELRPTAAQLDRWISHVHNHGEWVVTNRPQDGAGTPTPTGGSPKPEGAIVARTSSSCPLERVRV